MICVRALCSAADRCIRCDALAEAVKRADVARCAGQRAIADGMRL